jgi:hypothetical protein
LVRRKGDPHPNVLPSSRSGRRVQGSALAAGGTSAGAAKMTWD